MAISLVLASMVVAGVVLVRGDGHQPERRANAFAQLEARPLRLPELRPEAGCPSSGAIQLPGMSERSDYSFIRGEAALGPGDPREPDSSKLLRRLRRGPVYVVLPATPPRVLDLREGRSTEVLWVSHRSYNGRVLVRGGQLDGSSRIGFGTGRRPWWKLRLPAGEWSDERERLFFMGSEVHRRTGWRTVTSTLRIPDSGCYAFQVDGESFSYRLVFTALLQQRGSG